MLTLAGLIIWLWRGQHDRRLRAAMLCVAAVLGTPYCFDYDMMILAPALAFLCSYGLERGFLSGDTSLLLIIAVVPLVARTCAEQTAIPLGLAAMLTLVALIIRHARRQDSPNVEEAERKSRFIRA